MFSKHLLGATSCTKFWDESEQDRNSLWPGKI